jgi:hypothetical protein
MKIRKRGEKVKTQPLNYFSEFPSPLEGTIILNPTHSNSESPERPWKPSKSYREKDRQEE